MNDPTLPPLLAGIEAGGTKIVCAVARQPEDPLEETRIPTGNPAETFAQVIAFFEAASNRLGAIQAMGIGTFGPADLQPDSPTFGSILTTPKPGWKGFNLVEAVHEGLGESIPIAFETDVNAAAVGEAVAGAGQGKRNVAYVTVGTGIGGGVLLDGQPLHGKMHPEIGHLTVPDLDAALGHATQVCPFHPSCLEGRASGPAIEARWGKPGRELPVDHPAWELEARYLAHGAINLTAAWSPDVILFGGGVLQQTGLIDQVRTGFIALAGDYWTLPPLEDYLQLPALGQKAGIVGALALAQRLV